jgi:NhaP-type Na+/H+ or K+/H+ antiporter
MTIFILVMTLASNKNKNRGLVYSRICYLVLGLLVMNLKEHLHLLDLETDHFTELSMMGTSILIRTIVFHAAQEEELIVVLLAEQSGGFNRREYYHERGGGDQCCCALVLPAVSLL